MNNKVYIFLPVHNRCEVTRRLITCLTKQTFQNFHLVLIDDGSVDGTVEMVRQNIESLTVITGEGDWWWAGSLQQAYEWLLKQPFVSRHDVILIVNDDTEFKEDLLERGLKLIGQNKETLVLSKCYSKETGLVFDAGVHVDWRNYSFKQATFPEQINCLSTRGLFLRVDDFIDLGGFYPRALPHYLSDYEFTIRAHRRGKKLVVDPSLILWVDESTTGYRTPFNDSFVVGIQKLFSKKCIRNPVARTVFIALACPWRRKMCCWLRVWCRAGLEIMTLLNNKKTS